MLARADAQFPRSISVVMPVRNRAHIVGASLKTVIEAGTAAADGGLPMEILVTDDASDDGTLDIIHETARSSPLPMHVIEFDTRQGPAIARNAAIERATGDLVVFVDSDVIVPSGFFEAHMQAHREQGPDIYVNGALVWVTTLEEALAMPPPTVWDFSGRSLGTANASVLREHLNAVGGFDPAFRGMGWEDSDLGRRLQKFGLRRIQLQEALAYHVEPAITNAAQLEARLAKERERGMYAVHYMAKHPEFRTRLSAQDTAFHRFLSWVMRMGGIINEDNLLTWMERARRRGWHGMEKIWFEGVITKVYSESLQRARTRRTSA